MGNDSVKMVNSGKYLLLGILYVILSGMVAFHAHAGAPTSFKTPDEAVDALIKAVKAQDKTAVREVLGVAKDNNVISSGDAVEDQNAHDKFIAAYDEQHKIDERDNLAILVIGKEDWPFPIPMVRADKDSSWKFDEKQGEEEILFRRIGRNEVSAIETTQAYVDAQNDYADIMRKKNGVSSYAQKLISTSGKQDGLYWPDTTGTDPSPLGELFAQASAEGYGKKGSKGEPYHGYYYKILTKQGADAQGGKLDYVARGRMIGGFGLVAWPAEYGNSGVKTFIVNQDAVVYEKDLGPATDKEAVKITSFDPGKGWEKTDDKKD